jgi:hypothetical protein
MFTNDVDSMVRRNDNAHHVLIGCRAEAHVETFWRFAMDGLALDFDHHGFCQAVDGESGLFSWDGLFPTLTSSFVTARIVAPHRAAWPLRS